MENTILTAARAEQQELEHSLAAIDADYAAKKKSIVHRLEAVKALRSAYNDTTLPVQREGSVALAALVDLAGNVVKAVTTRENTLKARVLSAAVEILQGTSPVKTQLLVEEIEKRGVEFTARDKAGNLSVLLSKDDRFVSDRRNGWSLTDRGPQDVEASAGLSKAEAVSQSIAPNRV